MWTELRLDSVKLENIQTNQQNKQQKQQAEHTTWDVAQDAPWAFDLPTPFPDACHTPGGCGACGA
jgi:hypothetical protein